MPYQTETRERYICGKTITVVEYTPICRPEERDTAKKAIEQRLYDVFSRYVPQYHEPV